MLRKKLNGNCGNDMYFVKSSYDNLILRNIVKNTKKYCNASYWYNFFFFYIKQQNNDNVEIDYKLIC